MKIESNVEFKELCEAWKVPADLQFELSIPKEVQLILDDDIIENKYGIRLKRTGSAHPPNGNQDLNKSQAEDSNNHFHVDWHVRPVSDQDAFRLGVKTLVELTLKFLGKGYKGICFTFYFQGIDMRKEWNKKHGFEEPDEELYISDRLSFHRLRPGEEVFEFDPKKRYNEAYLLIEI